VQRLCGQHLVEGVVANVCHERHAPDEQRAGVAELWPRLDHLREPELRALGRVECHEESAEQAAEDHGDRGPQEVAAECDADDSDRERREMRVPREPHRPEMPDLAVALGERHVVDRARFDERAVSHRSEIGEPGFYIMTSTF